MVLVLALGTASAVMGFFLGLGINRLFPGNTLAAVDFGISWGAFSFLLLFFLARILDELQDSR